MLRVILENLLKYFWYEKPNLMIYSLWWILTLPLKTIYFFIFYTKKILNKNINKNIVDNTSTKIIVIGNFTAGGSGKTPVLIEIANFLNNKYNNINIGIISRGYGRIKNNNKYFNNNFNKNSAILVDIENLNNKNNNKNYNLVKKIGDEPTLILEKTQLAIAVHNKRNIAIACLEKYFTAKNATSNVDLNLKTQNYILSDDGMQHFAMARNLEIAVINDLGNQALLPTGPMREILRPVDYILLNAARDQNGHNANLYQKYASYAKHGVFEIKRGIQTIYPLFKNTNLNKNLISIEDEFIKIQNNLKNLDLHLICGIAKPDVLFKDLQKIINKINKNNLNLNLKLELHLHACPDHASELLFEEMEKIIFKIKNNKNLNHLNKIILMTEKDAVKIKPYLEKNHGDLLNLKNLSHSIFYVLPLHLSIEAAFYQSLEQNL